MNTWPDQRIQNLFGADHPILLAPMAGAAGVELAIGVARGGALGALPCAMLNADQVRQQVEQFRHATAAPLNLNFFCHTPAQPDAEREARWKQRLAPYYLELGIDSAATAPAPHRAPFDAAWCSVVEALKPQVVSFHFGLPDAALLARVKASGARVISSATTVEEAIWLERGGCDAIIAMGVEAGGHRGMFLSADLATQVGTFALVPQVVDAVRVPVIAAGGIADARGITAAFALGASAVQIGTAYLLTPEARTSTAHRAALRQSTGSDTAITHLFTGRPARGIVNRLMREVGAMSDWPPAFPTAGAALGPLRAHDESAGSSDFTNLWAGQAARLALDLPAEELTRRLTAEVLARIGRSRN